MSKIVVSLDVYAEGAVINQYYFIIEKSLANS